MLSVKFNFTSCFLASHTSSAFSKYWSDWLHAFFSHQVMAEVVCGYDAPKTKTRWLYIGSEYQDIQIWALKIT